MACGAGGFRHRRHDATTLWYASSPTSLSSSYPPTSTSLIAFALLPLRAPRSTSLCARSTAPPLRIGHRCYSIMPPRAVPRHFRCLLCRRTLLLRARRRKERKTPGRLRSARSCLPSCRFHHSARHRPSRDAREYLSCLFSDLYVAESASRAVPATTLTIAAFSSSPIAPGDSGPCANTRMALVLSAPPPAVDAPTTPAAAPAAAPPPAAAT